MKRIQKEAPDCSPEKLAMNKIIKGVYNSVGASQQKLHIGCRSFKVIQDSPQRRGRKEGSFRVSTEQLCTQLETVSAETSTMHNKLEIPMRSLNSSKRMAAATLSWGVGKSLKKASCARELQTTDCSSKRTAHLEENVMLVSHGSIMVDLEWCT